YMYFDMVSNAIQQPEPIVSAQITRPPEQLLSQIMSWQDASTRQLVQRALPKIQIVDDNDVDQSNATVALVDKVIVTPKTRANHQTVATQTADATSKVRGTFIARATAKKPLKLAEIKKVTPVKVANKAAVKLISGQYTIQLFATHQKKDIEHLRQTNKLFTKASMMHFTNEKGSWYLLTLGEYNNKNQAQLQASRLPPALSKLKPWIRSTTGLTNMG
ncbi:MAG: SPOR domain-containing protein, partial [Legionellales bacterium]